MLDLIVVFLEVVMRIIEGIVKSMGIVVED